MSLTALYFHLVIRTKNGKMTIPDKYKHELYSYMAGIIMNRGCQAVIINGMANHIHMLIKVSPAICFSDLVHDLKLGATHYMKMNADKFSLFEGWSKEYAAFSCSAGDRSRIKRYIEHQEEHHQGLSAEDELKRFCELSGLEYRET